MCRPSRLLGLFAVQYALPGQAARYLLCVIYGTIAVAALARNRRYVVPVLAAPFRGLPGSPLRPEPGGAGTAVLEAPARTRAGAAPVRTPGPGRGPRSPDHGQASAGLPRAGQGATARKRQSGWAVKPSGG